MDQWMTYKQVCAVHRRASTNIHYNLPDWPELEDLEQTNMTIVCDGSDYEWFKREQQTASVRENGRVPFSKT